MVANIEASHSSLSSGRASGVVVVPAVGIVLGILLGSLLQWPTLLTLVMFPILAWMYVRLARREARDVRAEFGEMYTRYAAATPAFVPRLRRPTERRA